MPARDWKEPLRRLVAWLFRNAARWSAVRSALCWSTTRSTIGRATAGGSSCRAHALALIEAQLRHAGRAYRVVPARDIVEAVASRRRGGRVPLAITFDDDLPSHVGLALPALAKGGHRATFFLTGASLEEPAEFWWERLQRIAARGLDEDTRRRLVEAVGGEPESLPGRDWALALGRAIQQLPLDRLEAADQLLAQLAGPPPAGAGLRTEGVRQLVAAGHEIGFHTLRHLRLPTLDGPQLEQALQQGRDELAAVAGAASPLLAYPFGRANERVAAAGPLARLHPRLQHRAAGGHPGVLSVVAAARRAVVPLTWPLRPPARADREPEVSA